MDRLWVGDLWQSAGSGRCRRGWAVGTDPGRRYHGGGGDTLSDESRRIEGARGSDGGHTRKCLGRITRGGPLLAGSSVALRRGAGLRRGENAGLPELDELFQAAEDAGQAGDDQVVDGGRDEGAPLLCVHGIVHAGDLVAEGGVCVFHGLNNN